MSSFSFRSRLSWCTAQIVISLFFSVGLAQQHTDTIYVESWRRGEGKINEQTLTVRLSREQLDYETYIFDSRGQREFKFALRHHPPGEQEHELEYWTAEFSEVKHSAGSSQEILGDNLLKEAQPGPNKDYFPRGDWVGYLYPKAKPQRFLENYYSIDADRVIKVEHFYVVIRVDSYQYDNQNPKLLTSLKLTIEFKNTCDQCSEAQRL